MASAGYQRLLADTNSGERFPLEEFMAESGESRLAEQSGSDNPFAELVDAEQRERLIVAIDDLPEREKQLMALHYQERLNLKEIGGRYGGERIARLPNPQPGR